MVAPGGSETVTCPCWPADSYMRKISALLGGKQAGVRGDLGCGERVVEFVTVMDCTGLLPVAGMRVERVGKVLRALVCFGVGAGG